MIFINRRNIILVLGSIFWIAFLLLSWVYVVDADEEVVFFYDFEDMNFGDKLSDSDDWIIDPNFGTCHIDNAPFATQVSGNGVYTLWKEVGGDCIERFTTSFTQATYMFRFVLAESGYHNLDLVSLYRASPFAGVTLRYLTTSNKFNLTGWGGGTLSGGPVEYDLVTIPNVVYSVALQVRLDGTQQQVRYAVTDNESFDEGDFTDWVNPISAWSIVNPLTYVTIGHSNGSSEKAVFIDDLYLTGSLEELSFPSSAVEPIGFEVGFQSNTYLGSNHFDWFIETTGGSNPYDVRVRFKYQNYSYDSVLLWARNQDTGLTYTLSAEAEIIDNLVQLSQADFTFDNAKALAGGSGWCFLAYLADTGSGFNFFNINWATASPQTWLCLADFGETIGGSTDIDKDSGFILDIVQQERPCGLTDISGCIIKAFQFMFIPSRVSMDKIWGVQIPQDKAPWSYFVGLRNMLSEQSEITIDEYLEIDNPLAEGKLLVFDVRLVSLDSLGINATLIAFIRATILMAIGWAFIFNMFIKLKNLIKLHA